jgi:predicted dehydrogenase
MRRVGLIGAGGIVRRTHAVGYAALGAGGDAPGGAGGGEAAVRIVAVADPAAASRDAAGAQFGIAPGQRYADYRDLLARAPVDTVVIATPHAYHVAQAVAAAEAGKAIVSEKPMAVTLEEADAILGAVARHGVPYSVVHNCLFAQPVLGARALLESGAAGEVLLGRGEMLGNKPLATTTIEGDWRASRAMGGGAVIDSAYHEIYTVEALMGSPVRAVSAHLATLKFPIDVDDTALLTFEHANGRVSSVAAAWHARSPGLRGRWVWLNGTEGAVRVVYADAAPLSRQTGGARAWEPVDPATLPGVPAPLPGDATGHGAYLRAAFDALERGAPPPISGAQARHNLAIIAAARESSAARRAVEVAA